MIIMVEISFVASGQSLDNVKEVETLLLAHLDSIEISVT